MEAYRIRFAVYSRGGQVMIDVGAAAAWFAIISRTAIIRNESG